MEFSHITELMAPFLGAEGLSQGQLAQTAAYVDLLLKWNARMNLTAIRDREQILVRHFGESFFAAVRLFPDPAAAVSVIDVGSGAGFPGLAMSIVRPHLRVTLLESHGKKAVFLKEAARVIGAEAATVRNARAEDCQERAKVVTLRAVEKFESVLPVAAELVQAGGKLGLLIGAAQAARADGVLSRGFEERCVEDIPGSAARVLLSMRKAGAVDQDVPRGTMLK